MLVRTRPYRPSVAFRTFDRSFDRAFEQLTSSFFTTAPRTPVVDASWHDGDLVLTVDLPGVAAEQVGVAVSGRTLTLSAQTEHASWERSISHRRRPRPRVGLGPSRRRPPDRHGRRGRQAGGPHHRDRDRRPPPPSTPASRRPRPAEGQPENGTSDNA